MKDTFYFSHDYNARTDPKIKRLMARQPGESPATSQSVALLCSDRPFFKIF